MDFLVIVGNVLNSEPDNMEWIIPKKKGRPIGVGTLAKAENGTLLGETAIARKCANFPVPAKGNDTAYISRVMTAIKPHDVVHHAQKRLTV